MYEDKLYSQENPVWDSLSEEQKTEVLEKARYLTFTGNRAYNLLPVFYVFVGVPLLIGVFAVLPYLYLWQSIWIVPFSVVVIQFVGNFIHRRIHARLMLPAISRILAEYAVSSE